MCPISLAPGMESSHETNHDRGQNGGLFIDGTWLLGTGNRRSKEMSYRVDANRGPVGACVAYQLAPQCTVRSSGRLV